MMVLAPNWLGNCVNGHQARPHAVLSVPEEPATPENRLFSSKSASGLASMEPCSVNVVCVQ